MTDAIKKANDRLLIVTSSSTGNNIFCTPAIHFLRKHLPESTIDVISLKKLSAEVFQDNPDIDHLYVVDSTRKFDAMSANYTKVICLNLSALRRLRGMKTTMLTIPPFTEGSPRADQVLQFVSGLIGKPVEPEDRHYVICSGKPVHPAFLDPFKLNADDQLVNIHMGCGTTLLHGWKFFYKDRASDPRLWPVDNYIKLGKALIEKNPRIRIVLTGTSNEAFLAKKFAKKVAGSINLVGKTSVSDLFNLMSRVNLFVAHDCGVLHVASGSDVPMLGLYGPTTPELAGPYPSRPQHLTIKKPTMAEIEVHEVVDAAMQLLARYPQR